MYKEQVIESRTVFPILLAISFSHLLNDTIQSLIPSTYPLLKHSLHLNFAQLGLITFCFQLTASLLQPFVGLFTDRRPQPWSLATGMCFTLVGLVVLSLAPTFQLVLVAVALVGVGSSIFHPESSRVAYLASGGRTGLAQSLFQVGGNAGSALGPLLAALIVAPFGRSHILWFSLAALLAIAILAKIGGWYKKNLNRPRRSRTGGALMAPVPGRRKLAVSLGILLVLIFSKYFYMASMSSYYIFYLMDKFHLSVQNAQLHLFLFLFAVAAGTLIGGPVGDRVGRKYVIWFSILGVAPFTLLLPYGNLFWTSVLSVFIGVILASAFSAILVYAQELVPGKVGLIAGLFFGLAFGMGGLGSAVLGQLADRTSIGYVFHLCSFLPLLGLLTGFLPDTKKATRLKTDSL
ncbi:MAG: MFS transporter [Bacteroidota bacterium]|nr:MFS transporter [Bacteroidota bacterium]MDP4217696.1 MFS transporter [Bacteroidota bacterium]MDP4246116.1 MFS transporter [Bacteroidota bacterium]MDP4252999.1 MFS transporter [Bacteroidota bacterium]MDP4257152.1 MFS transporter [Bacteroidota bacterium]